MNHMILEGNSADQWTRSQRRKWLVVLAAGTTLIYASRTCVPLLIPTVAKEKKWSRTDSGAVLSSFFWGYTLTYIIALIYVTVNDRNWRMSASTGERQRIPNTSVKDGILHYIVVPVSLDNQCMANVDIYRCKSEIRVVGGYIADKIGGQKVILIAALGWSIITVAMPLIVEVFSQDFGLYVIILFRIAHGAFQGVHFPGMSSLASKQLSDRDRASFFSVATSGSAFGILLTGTLGSYILENSNWQSVFYVIGGMCCSWSYVFYHLCRTPKRAYVNVENHDIPWAALFRQPAFWSCVFAHACQNNCFFTLLSWLPTYFHDLFPEAKGWLVNMVPWLFTVPCTFLGKWISESFLSMGFSVTATRKTVEALCLLTQAFGLLALDNIKSLEGVLACMVIIIGATGFHNSAVVVNPGDLAPKHSGSVFGLMNTVGSIPGFVSVYAAGQILEKTHSWSAIFNSTAAVNIIGCVLYVWFGSGNPIIQ